MEVLDGDVDEVFALHGRLPQTLVLPVLTVQDAAPDRAVVRGGDVDLGVVKKKPLFLTRKTHRLRRPEIQSFCVTRTLHQIIHFI